MIQVNGNLKVKLPPSKVPVSSSSGEMELVEPSVVSFIGECHRIESDCSAMDVVLPLTTFSWTKTLDRKLISIDPTYVRCHVNSGKYACYHNKSTILLLIERMIQFNVRN